MERVLTVAEMREAERYTESVLGLPESTLIERAGVALADEIIKRFAGGRVLVCVGRGNNGKDGKTLAKILSARHGFSVSVFNAETAFFKLFDKKFDIIVDCLFGTGLNREVTGRYKTAIDKINESGAFVISCDIPSGINGDSGKVMGAAVKADLTIAVQEYKTGLFLGDGIEYSGETVARDIGISVWTENCAHKMTDKDVTMLFPERKRTSNKGDFGRVAVVGGSKSYSGSVILSKNALSAYKTGAGYSQIAVPECIFNGVMGLDPECVLTALPDDGNSVKFDKDALLPLMKNDAIAFGMGMGVTQGVYDSLRFLLENYNGRLLIDADGLNALAKFGKEPLKNKKCQAVLTPHIGEFCRLSGKEKEEVLSNSVELAKDFAAEYGVTLLLKNAVSVITDGKVVYLNVTGNCGMAKGGSGDVLSGILAGMLLRKEDLGFTVAAGAYLFGKAGDIAAKTHGNTFTVTATDIISAMPCAVREIIS